jgi:hypothetical protein
MGRISPSRTDRGSGIEVLGRVLEVLVMAADMRHGADGSPVFDGTPIG